MLTSRIHAYPLNPRLLWRVVRLTIVALLLGLLAPITPLATLPAQAASAQPSPALWQVPPLTRVTAAHTVTWRGNGPNARWSDPQNWDSLRVPGGSDRVILSGAQNTLFDLSQPLAGLVLAADFSGTLYLARPLTVAGELRLEGGELAQAAQPVHVAALTLAGGEILGGAAPFAVDSLADITAGLWTTPGALATASALNIADGATVRLGTNGSLVLTGAGDVLTGGGLLDTLSNRPNSVEFKGQTTQDLMLAGPSRQFRAAGLDKQNYDPSNLPANSTAHTFARIGAVTFNAGEDSISSAVIDTAKGFAYFGVATTPGIVVKVDVNPTHTLARIGAVTLNSGEDYPDSAVIDTANGFAYFGTTTSPGIVVKVDVNPTHTFTETGALTLNTGENYFDSAVIDAAKGFAYFGAKTNPGIVVKVDVNPAHSFARSGAVTLNAGENSPTAAVIDTANGFAYFSTYITNPSIVIKVDLGYPLLNKHLYLPLIKR